MSFRGLFLESVSPPRSVANSLPLFDTGDQMVDSLVNPLFQFKMPLLDGPVASTGLSNPKTMSDYLDKQTTTYAEAYFPYDPRAKEGAQFTSPWSSSKSSLLDGRSSTSHLSGMEGKQHMFFRQNSNSSKEGAPVLSPLHAAPVKQGFTLYSKSPGVSSSTAAASVAVGPPRGGDDDSTPQSGNPVYLAVPKPVYGHSPCCGELCCMRGRYCVESGFARVPHPVYKHNWMQSETQYSESAEVQKKAQEALLHHRGLQFEAGAERLKRMEACSPGRVRPLPSIINPNYSRYPCMFFGPFGEQSKQTPPRAYPNVFASHHAYEHMTSEVYQEHSPMTKYGPVTQHPVFYYSQADVEVENKNIGIKPGEDSPVAVKHTLPSPQEHFVVPRSLHGEAPLPHFQHGALLQGFGYPCYGGPRFNVGVGQSMQPPPVVQSNMHFSATNLCPDYRVASGTSLHEDGTRIGVGRSGPNSSFFRVDQNNPPRSNQPFVPTPDVAVDRLFHPSGGMNRPGLQTPGMNVERFLSYSPGGGNVRCPKLPNIHPIPLGSLLQSSLHHYPDHISKAAHDQSNVHANVCPVKTESKANDNTSSLSVLKRSNSQSSPPVKIKEETDLAEDEPLKKWKKVEETETVWVRNRTESPPMPVIDNVFSLAHYQVHMQSPGVLYPGRTLHSVVQSENPAVQTPPVASEKRDGQSEMQPLDGRDSKENRAGGRAQKPPLEIRKPQDIKVEKDEQNSVDQQDCPPMAGRKNSEQTAASSIKSLLVIKKCDPEELEMKSIAVKTETSDKSNPDEEPMKASPQSNTEDACQQTPSGPSQPTEPEPRVDFQNGLPCCLKLSTYNFVLAQAKCTSPSEAPEKPSVPPPNQDVPNLDGHLRVRKHFYELHHSLYKLISKSVFATSEQELRTLLSQLELTEMAYPSSKIKNMSSLLGVRLRELWFNEDVKSVFHELVKRLEEYTMQERCPFPHVMRTSAVFLPMLVLKELLFPMVQSSVIDQVLQQHKVVLRPTTLSEEKILLQLHKRACSSRLRKLMSLKHLPDIYADLVNILYYTCISKHLGLDADNPATRVKDEVFEVTIGRAPASPASPASPSEFCSSTPLKNPKGESTLTHNKTKSRIKHSSRRLFLDESLTDEEKADEINGGVADMRGGDDASGHELRVTGDARYDSLDTDWDAPENVTSENSWMCPLNFEEASPSDAEVHAPSGLMPRSAAATKPAAGAKNCSGVILKLRRMLGTSLNRKKARYQAISDRPVSQNEDSEVDRRTPKLTHRQRRMQSFRHALRPVGGSSKRSLLKIKYCPYLSTCYGAEHRRRWVLRSAVQRARSLHYPDLVGKRIHHLYEEDDKSEVWYRGEVLRVHEAHANPLKTIFEVRYDSEPEWRYYLELLIDYKKGWLKVEN